ncbi:uncharacterized protein LOC103315296 isoform X1 [Nasonia vitripennis]|uniref:Uncharacterized protein n=1 Tax=Nasonia vitripennis TaxID=7425 RepID=A0A7M7IPS9_NASVI|nr:uncharacterized protein LOC103315296 isoform X1 [Nasonia vitripennis]
MLKSILSMHGKCKLILRVIAFRNLSETKYQESFQCRIIDYFESIWNAQKFNQQFEVSSQIKEKFCDASATIEKYESLDKYLKQLLNTRDLNINENSIDYLDMQCSSLVHFLRHSEVLSLLNAFLKVAPYRFKMTDSYNKSMPILLEAVGNELLNNHQLVQVLFFLSLNKDKSASSVSYLKSHLTNLKDLPLIEKCIVAQAFYKSSVKLEQYQSKIFEQVLEKEYNHLIADQILLVSLCKAIRISGASDELNLKKLSQAIIHSKIPFTFTTIVHVLGLYAEALILEPKAINRLVKDSIEIIKQDGIKCSIRLKDLDRFLWSISHLGLTLTLNQKSVLQMYFEQRINEYKIKVNLGILVNSVLCLHMLQCWNKKVIKNLLEENIFMPVFYEKYHWKIRSRLQLLISLIIIEMKLVVPHNLKKQIKISSNPSKYINAVAEIASSLVEQGMIRNVVIECPIRTLQIPGVTLITDKNIYHIDVLDNLTCFRNTNIPHGLMKLKIRLLSRLKYRQIAISNRMFKDSEALHTAIELLIINSISENKT